MNLSEHGQMVIAEMRRVEANMNADGLNSAGCALRAMDAFMDGDFIHIVTCAACTATIINALMCFVAIQMQEGADGLERYLTHFLTAVDTYKEANPRANLLEVARDVLGESYWVSHPEASGTFHA